MPKEFFYKKLYQNITIGIPTSIYFKIIFKFYNYHKFDGKVIKSEIGPTYPGLNNIDFEWEVSF
jgi:hypothetical protein